MPPNKKVTEKIAPFHNFTSAKLTPNSLIKYIGRNGMSIVYPADIKVTLAVKIAKIIFQFFIISPLSS